jgi:hypothetical protein
MKGTEQGAMNGKERRIKKRREEGARKRRGENEKGQVKESKDNILDTPSTKPQVAPQIAALVTRAL